MRHADADDALERAGGGPDEIGAGGVVGGLGDGFRGDFNQCAENALGKTVLHGGVGREGEVLLHDVAKGVADAVGDLARWERESGGGIDHGEARENVTGWWNRSRTFLTEVRNELKRVTWPSQKEVYATTIMVILTSAFFGLFLWLVDLGLTEAVRWVFTRFGGAR